MIEKYEIEVQFGYWEPTQNDGRWICHTEKPVWWDQKPTLHFRKPRYGWGARLFPPVHGEDYWDGFGESKAEAIADLFVSDE